MYIGIDYNYMASCLILTALFEEKRYLFNMVFKGLSEVGIRGSSSVGRASAFQAECREFKSRLPLQNLIFTALKVFKPFDLIFSVGEVEFPGCLLCPRSSVGRALPW